VPTRRALPASHARVNFANADPHTERTPAPCWSIYQRWPLRRLSCCKGHMATPPREVLFLGRTNAGTRVRFESLIQNIQHDPQLIVDCSPVSTWRDNHPIAALPLTSSVKSRLFTYSDGFKLFHNHAYAAAWTSAPESIAPFFLANRIWPRKLSHPPLVLD